MGSKETILPPHVLIFPLPILGHLNSMLRLAELLCLAGVDITFIVSEFTHNRLIKHTDIVDKHFARYPGFQFQTVPDGLPDEHPRVGERVLDILPGIREVTAPLFVQMMVENNCFAQNRNRSRRPITCIIADGVLSFVGDFAEARGIPIVYFRTVSACSFWACFCIPELIQAGDIPVKGNGMDLAVKSVPGMETFLRRRDLPGFCRVNDIDEPKLQIIKTETIQTTRAQAVILNTLEDLEGPILTQIRKHMPRLFTIGPSHSLLISKLESVSNCTELGSNTISSGSFWKEDRRCMNWLDSQPEKSVLYVSFGSITVVTRVQILEFWHGLVNSGHRFLWVMRPDSVTGKIDEEEEEEQILQIPGSEIGEGEGEIEEGRSYAVVSWAPQQEVLNHSAIGGFLTHGGWNSILESIVAGVPMICWPYFADQTINSRFVSHVWKIGLDMKDTCDRNTIEKMVRELMEVRREEFMQRINRMAESARDAVSEGGSSFFNLDSMVEFIHSMIA